MQTPLPDKFEPWKLAAHNDALAGTVPLRRMPRLTALLSTCEGQVTVSMAGSIDERKIRLLTGRIEAIVEIFCQRCLEAMSLPVTVEFRLGLVRSDDQAAQLAQEYDPLVVTEESISLPEVVEDELILALPQVPLHPQVSQCEAYGFVAPDKAPAEEKSNPFAMLSTLLQNSKSKE